MVQGTSSAFQTMQESAAAASASPTRPGAVEATHEAIAAADTFDLSRTGATLTEQARQPATKLIQLLQPLEHEKPDLSVTSDLHLNLSTYG